MKTSVLTAYKTNCRVWVLDRRAFQQIMMRTGLQRIEENVKFLRDVPLLKNLDDNVLSKIADVLELVSTRRKEMQKSFTKRLLLKLLIFNLVIYCLPTILST